MKETHILEILDETGFAALHTDARRRKTVEAHCTVCADCRQAFDAARVSAALLNVRAARAASEPSAFFQSKVLRAIRESQNLPSNPIEAFRRWWQASFPLVCSMLLIVITLAVLTMLAPQSPPEQAVSTYNLYSTDSVILNQTQPRSITTEQALEVIYTERRDPLKR
jgi:predicted anti-sigma-YlaC factor YlaD